ncbi:MAG: acyl CoA:acetate/3-ketoacid CoA transferase [Opitutae bacterium]|nr:acyl CoA:acetate/3-ketoacid CoA transferase [Opitutae bacterium]
MNQTTADEAVRLIPDGATIATGGFLGAAHPEGLTAALERRFLRTHGPKNLTILNCAAQGDGDSRGLNHLAHEGLLKRVIAGHWGLTPKLGKLAMENRIEAYNFPQGVLCQLLRDIAAGRPGCVTHVGLDTFIDPINQGGKLNARTSEDLVERIELRGQTWLCYHTFPINVGLIRATEADPRGNLSVSEEAVIGEVLPIAQAVRNHGGIIIAQVKRLSDKPLSPHEVAVPGHLVDNIVLAEEGEHDQTFTERSNPTFYTASGGSLNPPDQSTSTTRRIIANRACNELAKGDVANLGIGLPEEIATIAAKRGLLESLTLTIESGPIGGIPLGGLSFGVSIHPQAIVDTPAQFDFYDGGGLDFSALGAAQVDASGNVNVSQFSDRMAGVGGFVNISQNVKRLVFCGTMTTGGLETRVEDGRLIIKNEGAIQKFVNEVDQVSFSGSLARESGREIFYVTERAVFQLNTEGLTLIEIAPGIDLKKDVLEQMQFKPRVGDLKPMQLD